MPEPEPTENENAFISRCIPIVLEDGTAADQKQATAICYSIWREHQEGKSEMGPSEKVITKKEADGEHPASHYLVVEDAELPSTWHLRVKDMDGKPDHRLMGAAWAALHGGYRGNRYEGPKKGEAISKLRRMYEAEDLETPPEKALIQALSLTTVKAVELSDGVKKLLVLAAPYGGPNGGKDAEEEYFSEQTDFMLDIGDSRPVIYFHGLTPKGEKQARPEVIGKATAIRRDDQGLWFEIILDKVGKFVTRIWEAAKAGLAKASTGAIAHLVRKNEDGKIVVWPIGEVSLFDQGGPRQPANEYAVVMPLKSLFNAAEVDLPEAFHEAETVEVDATQDEPKPIDEIPIEVKKEMAEEVDTSKIAAEVLKAIDEREAARKAEAERVDKIKAEAKAEALKEFEAKQPAWKGGFSTKKVTDLGLKDDDTKSFWRWVRYGDEIAAKAALQVGTSSEGGYLVPDAFVNQIVAKRNELSWVRQAGVRVLRAGADIINVPIQSSSTAVFVRTAEEGAVSEVEPTFNQVAITAHTWTKLIKISNQLLEDDQANLEEFLAEEIAQGWALTEGKYVATGTGSNQHLGITGVASDATNAVTYYDAASAAQVEPEEIMGMFYQINSSYRARAVWVMNGSMEAYLRSLRDANNWAFLPQGPATQGTAIGQIFGRPVFNEDSMTGTTSGVPTTGSSHVIFGDFGYYGLFDRVGLSIARNPYLYQGNDQTGIFCRARQGGAPLQGEAFVLLSQP